MHVIATFASLSRVETKREIGHPLDHLHRARPSTPAKKTHRSYNKSQQCLAYPPPPPPPAARPRPPRAAPPPRAALPTPPRWLGARLCRPAPPLLLAKPRPTSTVRARDDADNHPPRAIPTPLVPPCLYRTHGWHRSRGAFVAFDRVRKKQKRAIPPRGRTAVDQLLQLMAGGVC